MTVTRYEIKFVIPHEQARAVLDKAKDALVPDINGNEARYRVTSMYFDSPTHTSYWEKLDGESLRRKLRLRYYGVISGGRDLDERPYFLEIKYRRKDNVFKDRIKISTEFAREVLLDASALQRTSEAVRREDRAALAVARTIENYAAGSWLEPSDTISYEREAWQGAVDERVRLTFDRTVHAYPPEVYTNIDAFSGLPIVRPNSCVMEVKFNSVIPTWLREILVTEGLSPQRFSKYSSGLEAIGTVMSRKSSARVTERSVLGEPRLAFGS